MLIINIIRYKVNYRNILRYGLIVMMARRQTVHSYADARSHCV